MHFESERGRLASGSPASFTFAHVGAYAAHAENAGMPVDNGMEVVGGEPESIHYIMRARGWRSRTAGTHL